MAKAVRGAMTLGQPTAYLQIPKSTSHKKAQDGILPGKEVGRQWRFHKVAIDRWLGQRREQNGRG